MKEETAFWVFLQTRLNEWGDLTEQIAVSAETPEWFDQHADLVEQRDEHAHETVEWLYERLMEMTD